MTETNIILCETNKIRLETNLTLSEQCPKNNGTIPINACWVLQT